MKQNRSRNRITRQPGKLQSRKQAQPLPTEAVELTIESLSHDGRGVGRYQGKTAFIRNALPGETVMAQLTEEKPRFINGESETLISSHPHRIEPACPHYKDCGGCDLQHLDNSEQLTLKQQQVLEQIERIGGSKPEQVSAPLTAQSWNYRRSARIGINQRSDGEPIVGFRRHGSQLLTQIDSCMVLDPRVQDIFSRIREGLDSGEDCKYITQLDIDLGDSEGFLTLRLKKQLSEEHQQLFDQIAAHYALRLQLHLIGDESDTITVDSASYQLEGLTLEFRPGDFIQVNAEINQQMTKKAVELLKLSADDRVLDLFSGLGNFSLPVAKSGASVTGIEGSTAMVRQAEHNAELNNLSNCQFYRANLADSLAGLHWYRQPYNKIILDPPRAGAAELIPQVTALKPELILYISCNPGALARDTRLLDEQGYRMQEFLVMDMFPQTHHIESMALFIKGKKKAPKKKLFSGKGISR